MKRNFSAWARLGITSDRRAITQVIMINVNSWHRLTAIMNLYATNHIIDIATRRVRWFEEAMLLGKSERSAAPTSTMAVALRYLFKSKMLERQSFNAPASLPGRPLWTSSATPNADFDSIVVQLTQRFSEPFAPIEMITATRLLANLYGREYRSISNHAEWDAHRRLSKAFASHTYGYESETDHWHLLDEAWRRPGAMYAEFKSKLICVPFYLEPKSIVEMIEQLSCGGQPYELW